LGWLKLPSVQKDCDMSKPIYLKVSDTYFNKALNKLKALENDFANEVDDEMAAAALDIVTLAKKNAPVDTPRMRAAINSNKLSLLRHEVRVATNYAAFVEFGTGGKYKAYEGNLTNEWKNIAATHYVSGKGTTRPQPYLYPAVKVVLKKLKDKFKDRLKALLKK
jgi:HK97 gp10 family phage protein